MEGYLKKLAKVMLGSDEHFPPPNAPEGLLTRVRIEKVGGLGPWMSCSRDALHRRPVKCLSRQRISPLMIDNLGCP